MTIKSRALIASGQSPSKSKLSYCEVGQMYKVELIIRELGNATHTGFNLVLIVTSADVNKSPNQS